MAVINKLVVLIPLHAPGLMLLFLLVCHVCHLISGWGHLTLSRSLWEYYFGITFHGGAAVLRSGNFWPTPPPSKDPP